MKLVVKNIDNREITVVVPVTANQMCDIRLETYDLDNPKTYFITRQKQFKGRCDFKIKLPISPKQLVINIYNASVGPKTSGVDKTFTVGKVYGEKLQKDLSRVSWNKSNLKDFVDLACRFSYNLNYMPANTVWQSDGKNFTIELLPSLTSTTGQKLNTPTRIHKSTGKIQVSKEDFDQYTVPERMVLLFHEFSHFFVNENINDEEEADLNGLIIYLSLGFPVVEAYDAFANVFLGAQTEQNKKRYELIDNFIRSFDSKRITLT